MKVGSEDYVRLKVFFQKAWRYILSAEDSPVDAGRALEDLEKRFPSKAASGLRAAINDLVLATTDWPRSRIRELDNQLREEGAPTLTEVRVRYHSYVAKLLAGARLDEDEARTLRDIVSDYPELLDDDETLAVEQRLSQIEMRITELTAEFESPERGLIIIYADSPGWKIAAYRRDGSLIGDVWELRLADIPRYVTDYTTDILEWRTTDGRPADLAEFVAADGHAQSAT